MGAELEPALATLFHEPFFEDGWVYERKLDGMRVVARRRGSTTTLWSRTGNDVTEAFPEVAEALTAQAVDDVVVDGEVVAFAGNRTSFARLQPRIHARGAAAARARSTAVFYYLFDTVEVGGEDVRDRTWRERKRLLRRTIRFSDPLRLTPHRVHADASDLADACARGWEGLIAKREDAPYRPGRTTDWLKFKCEAGQELVVVGWTDPEGSRVGLGALLLGYHEVPGGEALAYAGKVGTGFSEGVLRDLRSRLDRLERETTPCTRGHLPRAGVHWARPELVAQVAFTEWTSAGQLRHPRFLGLRTDKDASDVVREG
jgi:bifunctional non-homologous end joining protein LigD